MNKNDFFSTSILEGSLDEINGQLYSIMDNLYDGVYITDGNAKTLAINRAYQAISGLTPEDVLGRNMKDIVADGLIDRSGTLMVLESKTHEPITIQQTFSSGKIALISTTPCYNDKGDINMVITVVRDITELHRIQEEFRQSEERRRSRLEIINRSVNSPIIAASDKTKSALELAARVAMLDSTVLLQGETGVGKEQFARYIYNNSPRSNEAFVSVNCGSIPENLIESELFGYEKGAFTGASSKGKMGVFESANKGTVFLDEIGDLPLNMQVHLLRVLQELQIKRVGGTKQIPVDVRIIAATNRDLRKMADEGRFRLDLFYRLNVVPIRIPPLRERKEDIIPLVNDYLEDINRRYQFSKTFSREALDVFLDYRWPGNVRELRNVVEQSVIVSPGSLILPSDLPIAARDIIGDNMHGNSSLKEDVARYEYNRIISAYNEYGNVRDAARSLGIDPATLVRKRKKYESYLRGESLD